MLISLFESLRYAGYFLPVTFLRIYIGFYFADEAWKKISGNFLSEPHLASRVGEWASRGASSAWYETVIAPYVIKHWELASYVILYCESLIAFSFLLGLLIRPVSLLAVLLMVNYTYISSPVETETYRLLIYVFITMLWLGAGRCLGLDYFFFKRNRGIWW